VGKTGRVFFWIPGGKAPVLWLVVFPPGYLPVVKSNNFPAKTTLNFRIGAPRWAVFSVVLEAPARVHGKEPDQMWSMALNYRK